MFREHGGIPTETLMGLRRRLATLPKRDPGRRTEVARIAELFGVSSSTVYRALVSVRHPKGLRRADRGRPRATEAARRLHAAQAYRGIAEPAGWIVRVPDRGPVPVAAGPTAREALALAREIGHGEGRQASPATAAVLDALDLPPPALGIAPGAGPWWREADS